MGDTKFLLKKLLQRMGYQIRRCPKAESASAAELHIDPFHDQAFIMGREKVQCIFDLGANIGQSAEKYRAFFPHARIISFEPFPESFKKCQEASAKLKPMEVHPLAIAAKAGEQTFYCTSFNPRNSLLELDESRTELFDTEISKVTGKITVAVDTLDQFCDKHGIAHIDILKMDIQGGELLALDGASDLFKRNAIDLVFLEVSFTETYKGHPLFFEIYHALHDAGFVLFDLYNCLKGKTNMALVEADAVFVRKEFLQSKGLTAPDQK